MQDSVRDYDAIGRYGGEEFLVVLPGADEEGVRMQAERMRQAIRSKPLYIAEAQLECHLQFRLYVQVSAARLRPIPLIEPPPMRSYRAKRTDATARWSSPTFEQLSRFWRWQEAVCRSSVFCDLKLTERSGILRESFVQSFGDLLASLSSSAAALRPLDCSRNRFRREPTALKRRSGPQTAPF